MGGISPIMKGLGGFLSSTSKVVERVSLEIIVLLFWRGIRWLEGRAGKAKVYGKLVRRIAAMVAGERFMVDRSEGEEILRFDR